MSVARNLLKSLTGIILLAALCAGPAAPSAQAASIRFETKVVAYSSAGWILVLPELRSVLGGRVRYDNVRRCWITDRVQRGEPLRITCSPTTPDEQRDNEILFGIYPSNGWEVYSDEVFLPYVHVLTIPYDTNFRDVVVGVQNSSWQWFERMIPIGPRP